MVRLGIGQIAQTAQARCIKPIVHGRADASGPSAIQRSINHALHLGGVCNVAAGVLCVAVLVVRYYTDPAAWSTWACPLCAKAEIVVLASLQSSPTLNGSSASLLQRINQLCASVRVQQGHDLNYGCLCAFVIAPHGEVATADSSFSQMHA